MSAIFAVSYIALWILFLAQSVAILLLLRQVGVLHLRLAPAGARVTPAGPAIGQPIAAAKVRDMDDPAQQLELYHSMAADVFLLFISPGCPVCASVMTALKPLVREASDNLHWVVVLSGRRAACQTFSQRYRQPSMLFAYAPDLWKKFNVGLSPYVVLVRRDGIVIGKGLVNHVEHLESLLEERAQSLGRGNGRPIEHITSPAPAQERFHDRDSQTGVYCCSIADNTEIPCTDP